MNNVKKCNLYCTEIREDEEWGEGEGEWTADKNSKKYQKIRN